MADLNDVPGIGRATMAKLERLGIRDTDGLLFHLPRRYLDLRPVPISDIDREGEWVTVKGRVSRAAARRTRRRGLCLAQAEIVDDTGAVRLIWFFRSPFRGTLKPPLVAGRTAWVTGRVKRSPDGNELHEVVIHDAEPTERFLPVYPLSEGLNQKRLRGWILWALEHAAPSETLPDSLLDRTGLPRLPRALRMLHAPRDSREPERGRRRLALGELHSFRKALAEGRPRASASGAWRCPASVLTVDEYAVGLPFALTGAQRRALEEISRDMTACRPMRRLLNGDVGSGKTVVAAYGAARAALAGRQALFMTPTRILAEQHHNTLNELLAPWGVPVNVATSGMDERRRRDLAADLSDGKPMVLVGTHALLSPEFRAPKAVFAVIDEQHRFGVEQRRALDRDGRMHLLAMSATPIPRTLAMAFYSDTDVSALDEKPPGRRPVDTRWIHPDKREEVYAFVRREAERGRQAYVICPRVHPETGDEDEASVVAFSERIANSSLRGIPVGVIHGQMSPGDQERAMRGFCEGRIRVLFSTTVIEVGVDVPNASVMVVERADQFGLAQLHQLRGRIGRGAHQSYCLLLADPRTDAALQRVNVLRKHEDGYRIAEIDLSLRGPGEFLGQRQSGKSDFRFTDFSKDLDLIEALRSADDGSHERYSAYT